MRLIIISFFLFNLVACAHKDIQKQSHDKPPTEVLTDEELENVIAELIIDSKYSIQQKSQFDSLRFELNEKLEVNNVINRKLRALLFKELLSPNYNKNEVQIVREMIQRNIVERNSLINESIEIANIIAGRTDPNEFLEQLRQELFLMY